ncbi:type IX secretion system periplasmic lipoprotein PorW/SprE [Rufibacter roseus]|uniref:Tetratricopeptide repeat protein n=1 Tax=Rufibacter roseus TaxID=1567108 RepID=A0ABW2DJ95_9BACT|nr:tetratricopeptide repeat protein [Rufibacter roseus]
MLLATVVGCAPEKPFGRFYHNLNARFNGYFLAREKMQEIEAKIDAANINDYNSILQILPPLDTTVLKTLRPELEEVIKRASFPIARHPKSRWVDDCYVLIGKARYYMGEEEEAIRAFRYVQTTSKDRHAKHEALVWLMRTYIRQKDYDNAIMVSEQFRKERMNEQNGLELLLTRAQLASIENDYQSMIQNLERAIPFADKRDRESRLRFILGQLYQATGQDAKAYAQFDEVLGKNPPYELGFYAKLNLAQVTELKDATTKEEVEKFLFKLANDGKNLEYLDKIYYDLAKLQLKQEEYQDALGYLKQSTAASTTNRNQKAYSYLLSGQIHYEHLQQYKLAQAYYDSTLQLLPPTALGYEELADRRTVLTAFVQQLEIIRTEDSLQTLAQLPAAERAQRVAQQIEREQEAERQAEQNLALAAANSTLRNSITAPNTPPPAGPGGANSTWYFDNPVAMASARNDFIRVWGDRPLVDNWRRRSALGSTDAVVAGPAVGNTTDSAALAEVVSQKTETYLAAIPSTPQQLTASHERLEEALFTLGNIYQQRLREPEQATATFLKLLQRYPSTEHASEAYYSLYVIAQSQQQTEQANKYAQLLKEKFPNSKYSRLIDQPDFLRTYSAETAAAHRLYDTAYVLYEQENYAEASSVLSQLSEKHPGNEFPDQISFLRALIVGRTQPPATFKAAMETFIQQFPDSDLKPKAQQYLEMHQRFESGELTKEPEMTLKDIAVVEAPKYEAAPEALHAFAVVHPAQDSLALKALMANFVQYNTRFFAKRNLKVEPVALNDSTVLLTVQNFADAKAAQQYSKLQSTRTAPMATVKGSNFATFVISEQNLNLLRQLKDLAQYLAFFEQNYQE